ncbi:MAG: NADP-dependent oxidoreductase [Steroidobacteraceae bacterium]
MNGLRSRRWLIADRPLGRSLVAGDFRLDEAEVPAPGPGEVLVRTLYLSFDPAQKGFMENVASYAQATALGAVMTGDGVGQVVASRAERFPVGSLVSGTLGWQEYALLGEGRLEAVRTDIPPTAALGAVGMTGRTAYFGLLHVGRARAGDTLVVSGAAGAVGSVAGQIGRIAGCRVIGIAGGRAAAMQFSSTSWDSTPRSTTRARSCALACALSCARAASTCSSTTSAA